MAPGRFFSKPISLLVFILACLFLFNSCIFGRMGRNCNCPTWGYEIKSTQEVTAPDATGA